MGDVSRSRRRRLHKWSAVSRCCLGRTQLEVYRRSHRLSLTPRRGLVIRVSVALLALTSVVVIAASPAVRFAAAGTTIGVVQSFGGANSRLGSSVSVSPASATAPGDLLVATIRDRDLQGYEGVTAVTDSAGNMWAPANRFTQGVQADEETWYAAAAASIGTGGRVTVTMSGTAAIAVTVLEVAGASPAPLDNVAGVGGTGTHASIGVAAASPDDIVIADAGWNTNVSPGAHTQAFTTTPIEQSTVHSSMTGEQAAWAVVGSNGTQIYSTLLSASVVWTASMVTFHAAAPAPPTPTPSATANGTPTPTATPTPTPSPTPTPTATPSPTATPTPPGVPVVHVRGNQLVDQNGNSVRMLGVNRSGAEYACAEGWGLFDGPTDTDAAIAAMRTWDINTVRLPLNEDCWLGINGVLPQYGGANYQNAIVDYVNRLNAHGILVILNLHFSAPGTTIPDNQWPMADEDHSPAFWASVATVFQNNHSVVFDLFNEPNPDGGKDSTAAWSCVLDGGTCSGISYMTAGMQQLVSVVRATGATQPLLIAGPQYAGDLDAWLQYEPVDPINQLIASVHIYEPQYAPCASVTCWNTVMAPLAAVVPIEIGELGSKNCTATSITPLLDFADAHGIGYTAWAWNVGSCTAEPSLITDYNGTPSQTFGQGFHDHMLAIAGG
jgi:endoglucanase